MVASAATCGSKAHWVYVLIDPRCGSVRYVGVTTNLKARLSNHIAFARQFCNSNNPTLNWLNELRELGLKPIQKCVSDALSINDAYQFESDTIRLMCRSGVKLAQCRGVSWDCRHETNVVGQKLLSTLTSVVVSGSKLPRPKKRELKPFLRMVFKKTGRNEWAAIGHPVVFSVPSR